MSTKRGREEREKTRHCLVNKKEPENWKFQINDSLFLFGLKNFFSAQKRMVE